jgi:hypothetical protein
MQARRSGKRSVETGPKACHGRAVAPPSNQKRARAGTWHSEPAGSRTSFPKPFGRQPRAAKQNPTADRTTITRVSQSQGLATRTIPVFALAESMSSFCRRSTSAPAGRSTRDVSHTTEAPAGRKPRSIVSHWWRAVGGSLASPATESLRPRLQNPHAGESKRVMI